MPKTDDGQGEFADVADKKEGNRNRANPRENRGRRGGDEDGEQRRGGEGRGRGGRGRGDGERRGRGDGGPKRRGAPDGGRDRVRTNAVDEDGNPTVDGAEAGGYRKGYQGKPREGDHPFDRKSGTGRGRRDDRRQGARDGWGEDKEKKPEAADGEEAKGEPTGEDDGNRRRNNRDRNAERRAERDAPAEKEESEEEVGFTLDDYEAQKKTGNLKTAAGRQHEKVNQKGIQSNDVEKVRTQMIATQITSSDTHAITRGAGAELLGFGAAKEDEFEYRQRGPARGGDRGGRGGRGGDRGARGGNRGGRRGGKPVFNANNEDDFPAL